MALIPNYIEPNTDNFISLSGNKFASNYLIATERHFYYANNFGVAIDDNDVIENKLIALQNIYVAPTFSIKHSSADEKIQNEKKQKNNIKSTQNRELSPTELISESPRAFVLGDPGSGKSTLFSWCSYMLSTYNPNIVKTTFPQILPLNLILRELDLTKVNNWDSLIKAYREATSWADIIIKNHIDDFEKLMCSGQFLIMIDGLDEISSNKDKLNLRNALIDALSRYPSVKLLISSRVVGFDINEWLTDIPLTTSPIINGDEKLFEHEISVKNKLTSLPVYYINPFSKDQLCSYIDNWFSFYVPQLDVANERKKNLKPRLDVNDGLSSLARIPVLLNMICFIHARRGRLPDGRAELYFKIAETYLTTLDKARNVQFEGKVLNFDHYTICEWLGRAALKIQKNRHVSSSQSKEEKLESLYISGESLIEIFTQGMLELGIEKNEAEIESKWLLGYITNRSGLLTSKGIFDKQNVFSFTHLSFQEFFTAYELKESIFLFSEDEWEWLSEKTVDSSWKEVFILLFEQLPQTRQTSILLEKLFFNDFLLNVSSNFPKIINDIVNSVNYFTSIILLRAVLDDTSIKIAQKDKINISIKQINFLIKKVGIFNSKSTRSYRYRPLYTIDLDTLIEDNIDISNIIIKHASKITSLMIFNLDKFWIDLYKSSKNIKEVILRFDSDKIDNIESNIKFNVESLAIVHSPSKKEETFNLHKLNSFIGSIKKLTIDGSFTGYDLLKDTNGLESLTILDPTNEALIALPLLDGLIKLTLDYVNLEVPEESILVNIKALPNLRALNIKTADKMHLLRKELKNTKVKLRALSK